MSQQDHDDPRPLADDDSRPVTDERQPDEAKDRFDEYLPETRADEDLPETRMDEDMDEDLPDESQDRLDERLPDEAHTHVQEPETEQLPVQTTSETSPDELFPQPEVERFRDEWHEIQARFVDDPRDAVQNADQLVDEIMKSITNHKQDLEGLWQQGSETEDLRLALQRYRTFFNQLLNA